MDATALDAPSLIGTIAHSGLHCSCTVPAHVLHFALSLAAAVVSAAADSIGPGTQRLLLTRTWAARANTSSCLGVNENKQFHRRGIERSSEGHAHGRHNRSALRGPRGRIEGT